MTDNRVYAVASAAPRALSSRVPSSLDKLLLFLFLLTTPGISPIEYRRASRESHDRRRDIENYSQRVWQRKISDRGSTKIVNRYSEGGAAWAARTCQESTFFSFSFTFSSYLFFCFFFRSCFFFVSVGFK